MRQGLNFSHIGLYVSDIATMQDFYVRALDFTVTDLGRLPAAGGHADLVFLSRDPAEHHQIVLISGRPDVIGFNVINQVSFKCDSLATLRALHCLLQREAVSDMQPVTHGNSLSLYVRDPEGNRLELYFELPWYVTQPLRLPVDLTLSESAIMAQAEAHARSLPGFRPRSEWQADMARRMGLA